MNRYKVTVVIELEATNQEVAEDIVRDIFESQPDVIDYEVDTVKDA